MGETEEEKARRDLKVLGRERKEALLLLLLLLLMVVVQRKKGLCLGGRTRQEERGEWRAADAAIAGRPKLNG